MHCSRVAAGFADEGLCPSHAGALPMQELRQQGGVGGVGLTLHSMVPTAMQDWPAAHKCNHSSRTALSLRGSLYAKHRCVELLTLQHQSIHLHICIHMQVHMCKQLLICVYMVC